MKSRLGIQIVCLSACLVRGSRCRPRLSRETAEPLHREFPSGGSWWGEERPTWSWPNLNFDSDKAHRLSYLITIWNSCGPSKKYFGQFSGPANGISTPPRRYLPRCFPVPICQLQTPPSPNPDSTLRTARHDLEGHCACADVRTWTCVDWIVAQEKLTFIAGHRNLSTLSFRKLRP